MLSEINFLFFIADYCSMYGYRTIYQPVDGLRGYCQFLAIQIKASMNIQA